MRSTVPRLSKSALQLYLVFGPQDLPTGQTAVGLIEQAAAGGVTCVQWRDKTALADTTKWHRTAYLCLAAGTLAGRLDVRSRGAVPSLAGGQPPAPPVESGARQ